LARLFTKPEELQGSDFPLVLQRVTVAVEDPIFIQQFSNYRKMLNTYDIIGIEPLSEKVFQWACTEAPVDVISLSMTTRLSFYPSFSTMNAAVQRGVHFEICWNPLLKESSYDKRLLMQNAAMFLRAGRKRNFIFCSGASLASEIRTPTECIHLGSLFGLSQSETHKCLTANARSVLLHAESRQGVYKSSISNESIVQTQNTQTQLKRPNTTESKDSNNKKTRKK
jgi:ribonuclease P/MRP protein subunit RPP1